uniref:SAM domain-containing protein n=1 Tax=Meleagris gallopavo TaxID=9103 RepID=A0A803XVJ5_MELGA
MVGAASPQCPTAASTTLTPASQRVFLVFLLVWRSTAFASWMLRLFLCFVSELEAKKACDWLRAAGFPQYAQLYEDSLFPLDIGAVKKDHSFLDKDSLKSLCR